MGGVVVPAGAGKRSRLGRSGASHPREARRSVSIFYQHLSLGRSSPGRSWSGSVQVQNDPGRYRRRGRCLQRWYERPPEEGRWPVDVRIDTDVAVIGGGPGGSAAAITCAARGWRVHLFERATFAGADFAGDRPGETLHPGVEPVLAQLGVADD